MTDNEIIKALHSIIDQQKVEIERLNVELVGMRGACESYKIHYDNAQAEVYELQKLLDLSNKLLDKKQKEMEGGSNE